MATLATSFIVLSSGLFHPIDLRAGPPLNDQLDIPLEILCPPASTTSTDSSALSSPVISIPSEWVSLLRTLAVTLNCAASGIGNFLSPEPARSGNSTVVSFPSSVRVKEPRRRETFVAARLLGAKSISICGASGWLVWRNFDFRKKAFEYSLNCSGPEKRSLARMRFVPWRPFPKMRPLSA